MKELTAILATARKVLCPPAGLGHEEGVLVTLFRTQGSTYRRPGARMLVLPGGRTVGTISGGCLETIVARQAWEATRRGRRTVIEIESAPEDDAWGPASGCHGKLFLLAEPITRDAGHRVLGFLGELAVADAPGLILHGFEVAADGSLQAGETITQWPAEGDVRGSSWKESGGRATFREWITPPPHLLICGAGDDAQPVARIAAELGWRITIVDSRARLATAERFPEALEISSAGPGAVAALIRRNTVAVLMSHRFMDDVEYLAQLCKRDLAYIGLLGPRRRTERLLAELADRALAPTAGQRARLFSPIGLDIGAEGGPTIALAIMAEIQAVLAGREGGSLSQKVGPVKASATESACPG